MDRTLLGEDQINETYRKWVRMGINFPAFKPSAEEPLVEELIAQTSIIGRHEPRLIECMAGWIKKHGNRIDTSRMKKFLAVGDSAVLGLVFDLLSSKEKTSNLRGLLKYCMPAAKAQMLFYAAETSATMKAQAIETETELNRRWNLYYVSLRIKTDAVLDRKDVLARNPKLASRASSRC